MEHGRIDRYIKGEKTKKNGALSKAELIRIENNDSLQLGGTEERTFSIQDERDMQVLRCRA